MTGNPLLKYKRKSKNRKEWMTVAIYVKGCTKMLQYHRRRESYLYLALGLKHSNVELSKMSEYIIEKRLNVITY